MSGSPARVDRRYDPANLPGDVIAGLTLWAVFAAQAIAYSRLAHATPTSGLVTAIAGAAIYALLGSSLRISIGPAGGIAAIVGTSVAGIRPDHLVPALSALTLMTAAFLFICRLLRISFLQRLFPTPVFVGYIAGTGVTILIGQGKELLTHGVPALIVGLVAIALVLLLKRFAPKVPGPFVVLLLATIASAALGFSDRGIPVIGTALGHFGTVTLPIGLTRAEIVSLIIPALGLALIVYVDGLANGDMLRRDEDPPIRPLREYTALGGVSLVAGVLGGFVAGCSTSRSLVGIRAGEKTRLAAGIAALLLFLTALSVVRFLQPMPLAALAGVVFVAAFDLINVQKLREMWNLRRADFVIAMIAGLSVVFIGMVPGVVIGVAAALIEVFRRAMQPHRSLVARQAGERVYEPFTPDAVRASHDLLIYRFGTGLFFGNAAVFAEDMHTIATAHGPDLHKVVVNADALGVPDASARESLEKAQRELAASNIRLVFGNARAPLRAALTKIGTFTLIDEDEFIDDLRKVRTAT